jgi:hypothetical protein
MTRELLSNRRKCSTRSFDHAGMKFDVCAGLYPDGRIGEIFLSSSKPGSAIEAVARDAAIVTSLALQFGCPINVIRHALTKDHDGSPATLLGAALAALTVIHIEEKEAQ